MKWSKRLKSLTKKGEFGPHTLPISGQFPKETLGASWHWQVGINSRQVSAISCMRSLWNHRAGFLTCFAQDVSFIHPSTPSVQFSSVQFSSLQSLSHVRLFVTPCITARHASLSITISWSSLRLTSIESVMSSSHLILGRPLLLLPPISPNIRVFSNESTLRMRWPKYWSFSFSIISSKESPGLISFRMDWLDLLAVQGTLKSLLQHHSSKASILRHLLHSPTLTSIHDHRKNHSLD